MYILLIQDKCCLHLNLEKETFENGIENELKTYYIQAYKVDLSKDISNKLNALNS